MEKKDDMQYGDFSILSSGTIPKYRRLYEILRQRIEDRCYLPGDRMPSERELIRETGLSLPTVRKTYDELMRDNYVARIQGRGTIVLERKLEKPLLRIGIQGPHLIYETLVRIFEFIDSEFSLSYKVETQLLQIGVLLEEAYQQFDIILASPLLLNEIKEKNLAASLRGRISLDRLDHPGIFAEYMQDDALRTMPLTWSPLVLCCNMNILRRIGFAHPEQFTRDDLMRLVTAVDDYRRNTGENVFSFPCTMLTYYRWLPFVWQDGCDIFYSENYDSGTLWKSIEFLRELYQHESCFVCPKMVSLVNEELFIRGNFAFSFICSFHLDYIAKMAEKNNFEYHLFELPSGERRITSITSLPFTISANSAHKTEAADLYRKFTNKKVQLELFKRAGFLPVAPIPRAELRDSVSEKRFAEAEFFFNAAVYGRSPTIRSHEKIDIFSQYMGMYFSHLISLEELKEALLKKR